MAEENNDSSGIVYAQQGLGASYYNLGTLEDNDSIAIRYLESSDSILSISLDYADNLPQFFKTKSKMLLAEVKRMKGDIKSALNLIRDTPELAD